MPLKKPINFDVKQFYDVFERVMNNILSMNTRFLTLALKRATLRFVDTCHQNSLPKSRSKVLTLVTVTSADIMGQEPFLIPSPLAQY